MATIFVFVIFGSLAWAFYKALDGFFPKLFPYLISNFHIPLWGWIVIIAILIVVGLNAGLKQPE